MLLTQVRLPSAGRDFLPELTFSADSLMCVSTPLCAVACINICAHFKDVKDPVVHVRVRWIMENTKTPSMHLGLVSVTLSQLTLPGKATHISHGRNPIGTIQL